MGKKNIRNSNIKTEAFSFLDQNREQVAKIGDTIFYFAELGMQEFMTSEYTAEALRQAGFDLEAGIAGLPPAWMATWGSGHPVIGVHCEADALPKCSQVPGVAEERPMIEGGAPGHQEGHNTNMAVMIGGAVAAKKSYGKRKY